MLKFTITNDRVQISVEGTFSQSYCQSLAEEWVATEGDMLWQGMFAELRRDDEDGPGPLADSGLFPVRSVWAAVFSGDEDLDVTAKMKKKVFVESNGSTKTCVLRYLTDNYWALLDETRVAEHSFSFVSAKGETQDVGNAICDTRSGWLRNNTLLKRPTLLLLDVGGYQSSEFFSLGNTWLPAIPYRSEHGNPRLLLTLPAERLFSIDFRLYKPFGFRVSTTH